MKKISIILMLVLFIVACQPAQIGEVKAFSVTISDFTYTPSSITVNQGDTVRLTVTNNDQIGHGISFTGVRESVQPGETKTIEFTATQSAKTFCSDTHGEVLNIEVI